MDIASLGACSQTPNQPTSFTFPRRPFGKKKIVYRSCHTCWFNSWTWLHYDEDKDVVLCFLCWNAYCERKLTSRVGSSDDAFISRGFCNWKDATIAFRQHERSKCHRIAIEKLSRLPDTTPIVQEIISRSPLLKEKLNNQHCLVKILGSLRYLAKQGCGLRKSDDSTGYLFQLLKFTSEGDPQLQLSLNNETLIEQFLSNESQNKLLKLMSNYVIRRTATEIQNTEFCTIMMDECTNAANEEQVVVALRWVDNELLVHENVIGLFELSIDDSSLFTQVNDALLHFNISLKNVRGWCYNGASKCTRDAFKAVMHNEQPLAFYMHCYGHSLNLAASDAVKHCSTMSNMLSITHEITKLIKQFPCLFGSIIKDGITPGTTGIRVLCPSRWTVKAESMLSIIQNYTVLQDMWDVAADMSQSSETIACIRGVAAQMKTFDFFFSLFLGETLLRYTDNLSRTLQKQSFSAIDKMKVAEQTKQTLANVRNDFDMFWAKVNGLLSEEDVSDPVVPIITKESEKENSLSNPNPKDYYRQVYYKALDNLVLTIEDRFDQLGYSMFCFLEMLFLKVFRNEDYSDALEKVNEVYSSDLDIHQLHTQLDVLNTNVPDYVKNIFDIHKYFQQLTLAERELMSEVIKLLKLILVLPATNSISDSSFSTMHRVKSYLQSTMSQERLSSIMILHAHNNYTDDLDLVEVATDFVLN